jgi:hypothetical protein
MSHVPPPPQEQALRRTNRVLAGVTAGFALLAVLLLVDPWGAPPARAGLPPVDPAFLDTTASRRSYADLARAKEDLSDFACYVCHEKNAPPPLRFDEHHRLVIPEEHETIRMNHGSHDRNNLCYNCHNEANLLTFTTRDGRELGFADSSHLCGSCHGPTYRDWEAGVHGRISGHWDRRAGPFHRLDCVNCHDPHSPAIPSRRPAPPPHPLRAPAPASVHHSGP